MFPPEAKSQALQRLRASHCIGDLPDSGSEDERQTLERLVATPLWECSARIATLLATKAWGSSSHQGIYRNLQHCL